MEWISRVDRCRFVSIGFKGEKQFWVATPLCMPPLGRDYEDQQVDHRACVRNAMSVICTSGVAIIAQFKKWGKWSVAPPVCIRVVNGDPLQAI